MSSPLSTLKKNRRAPLPEIGLLSDRERKPYKERSDTDYETTLFRDIFPQNQPAPLNMINASRSKVMQIKTKASPPSDFELMSSMMQKISQLEKKVKAQAMDIQHKARRISVLEDKLTLLQESKEKSVNNEITDDGLSQLCHKLQKQVWEMEKFLKDYGLIWVGSCEEPNVSCLLETEQDNTLTGSCVERRFEMNYDLVIQNIQELNFVAGEGESHVTPIPGGAKLTRQSSIPLSLYKNGIVMFNGPFRSYQDPTTQECMKDLTDGFFPSELQERFPNGVSFQVYDKRDEEFIVRQPRTEFPGRGQTIDGAARGRSAGDSEEASFTSQKQSQIPGTKQSMEQFLRKLPKCVVKSGKVISIRDSIQADLQGHSDGAKSQSTSTVETPILQGLMKSNTDCLGKDISTLRVKSEDGVETFILKMHYSETIGDLRHYLDMKRGPGGCPYDIISAFPKRCYSDDTQTLLSCGLISNAVLILRPQASSHRQHGNTENNP